MMLKKKAQLGNIQGIVLVLVLVGIILGVGFIVMEDIQDKQGFISTTVLNETINVTDPATEPTAVATAGEGGFKDFAIINCMNESSLYNINSGNYTYTTDGKIVTTATVSTILNISDWNCSYTYSYGGDGWEHTNTTIAGINEIPQWLTILVIIAIIGILLAIVFAVFPMGEGGSATRIPGFSNSGGGESGGYAAEY